jgi:ribosomal protein L39E
MRRLHRLEQKRRQNRRVDFWILFEDERVQNLRTGEVRRLEEVSDNPFGPIPFFISEADSRL